MRPNMRLTLHPQIWIFQFTLSRSSCPIANNSAFKAADANNSCGHYSEHERFYSFFTSTTSSSNTRSGADGKMGSYARATFP
jgi:hypothetical protein